MYTWSLDFWFSGADEVVMNMELAYYDDRTPKDYEPPGFRPAEAKVDHESMEVGEVETKFHR